MSPARVLLITNETSPGDAAGQIDGYGQLVETGELAALESVSHRTSEMSTADQTFLTVLDRVQSRNHDVVVIWTPGNFPHTSIEFERLEKALGSRPLLYWEGDPWGKGKPITRQMKWWLGRADIVFSTGGLTQANLYMGVGAKRVAHVANTYCHLKFAEAEAHSPAPTTDCGVVVIASNLARIPYLTGVPGSVGRRALVSGLRDDQSLGLRLLGAGWPRGWSAGRVAYARQIDELRRGRVTANWDHWPRVPDYSSDRLPISLIAGRPHVTTRHPGGSWLPGEEVGLFQESTPGGVRDRVRSLLDLDPAVTYKMGVAAHSWARHRVSHREAARYILNQVLDGVVPPPSDPWANLPGPWDSSSKP